MIQTNIKSVIIFRFIAHEGPGYLGDCLTAQNITWQLVKVDEGEALPASIAAYSGMVIMGGPMSVNDNLPWIAPILALIREAISHDIPVLGHCLGGQLMSKALGGVITQNAVKEIGWGEVMVAKMKRPKIGSEALKPLMRFTGTAKPLVCHRAQSMCLLAHIAKIRHGALVSIWRCKHTLK